MTCKNQSENREQRIGEKKRTPWVLRRKAFWAGRPANDAAVVKKVIPSWPISRDMFF